MRYKPNNVYLADCYKAIKDLPDKSVDLIYTDIPYDIEDNGGGGCFGEKKRDYHSEYRIICENNGSRIAQQGLKNICNISKMAYGIDYDILNEFCRVMKNINCYIWCSKKQIYPIMQFFIEKNDARFELLTWHKTNPIPTCNGKYLSDTEYCLFFHKNTKVGGSFETKSKYYISPINVTDKELFEHPTIKPLPFVKNHILNSTAEDDVVLDPFAGSGTTLVAAKELGRKYIGFEIDTKYYKIATDRLNGVMANGQLSIFARFRGI